MGRPVQSFPTLDELLQEMDAGGIERVVLQGWYWQRPGNCPAQNRFFAACRKAHPDRISVFAPVHPGAGSHAVREELRRAAGEGFSGLGELSPHSQGFAADDGVWGEVMSMAGELSLPVNLHVTDPAGKNYPGRIETPVADFVRWAREYPATRFILAHWGGRLPLDPVFGPEAIACRNLFFDTAASPLLYDLAVYREMVAAVGADRLVYGSDHPLDLYPQRSPRAALAAMVADVRAAGLTAAEQAALLGGNTSALLGI
jgi:predicted TIM-barrel fold metal-dependent hydrolase